MAGKSRIDWESIRIKIVFADKENPNPRNPCSKLSPKERKREVVSICGKIWSRAMKEKKLKVSRKKRNRV